MGKINVLSDNIANKIAAGEVVERPASVVKEMVENSLDAESTDIVVEVKNGGKNLIRIIDNGTGMSQEDAILSLERHATSKIKSIDDLETISTFGFRGEALPSVASVSHLELITQQKDELEGTRIRIEGGIIKEIDKVGSAKGTRISISNLFFNVPARQKFLKSATTELDHIIRYVTWAGLAYPKVSFKLISNDKIIIDARKCNSTMERIYTLYGKEFADNVVELDQDFEMIKIRAFIGKPGFTRTTRDYQLFFMNNRPIRSNLLGGAVGTAFKTILPKGRYPVAIIFIEIEPSMVDVNVHPAKMEVRFRNERTVYGEVMRCLLMAMQNQNYIPIIDVPAIEMPETSEKESPIPHAVFNDIQKPRENKIESSLSRFMDKQKTNLTGREYNRSFIPNISKSTQNDQIEKEIISHNSYLESLKKNIINVDDIQIKARLFDTYIIAESSDEVLFIDQHIADERVIYEKLRKQMENQNVQSQGLLLPITIELSASQAESVNIAIDNLSNMGFDIEPFGGKTIIVRSIPSLMQRGDIKQSIIDLIEQITNSYEEIDAIKLQDEILIMTACRSAIQAGDRITDIETANLVKELFNTEQPNLCPHGRPIIVRMKKSELDDKFQRK
jgi:DNA mismatch repair protein MutL